MESTATQTESSTHTQRQTISKAMTLVKKTINEDVKDKWDAKVKTLAMQGDSAGLLIEEKQFVTWQSIAKKKVPGNIMSFAVTLSTNVLASPGNLTT